MAAVFSVKHFGRFTTAKTTKKGEKSIRLELQTGLMKPECRVIDSAHWNFFFLAASRSFQDLKFLMKGLIWAPLWHPKC